MKRIFLIVALLWLCTGLDAVAQRRGTVSATLLDKTTNEAILGAVVEYAPVQSPNNKKHITSGAAGSISTPAMPYGEYIFKIMFIGYDDLQQRVVVNAQKVTLDTLFLTQKITRIDDVVLEAVSMRTTQKGDTLVYNAAAFKVTSDSDTEGLLSKMPGVTITDGGVEAQGEAVKKIFVDGKEFFGNDVNSAIKNLPAEVVDKVEVYNKLSDQAEFTGIDDGEGYKAINIVTKQDMRAGQFGKLYAGYGLPDKYLGGGNINVFKGDSRISFIGLVNNVNQQNFSSEDILGVTGGGGRGMSSHGGGSMRGGGSGFMVGQQSGVSKVVSFGMNYSDKWGEKVDFTGSYFFNTNRNDNNRTTDRQYYTANDTMRVYNSSLSSWSKNYNHRLNAKIDYRINENNSLMIRPSISLQNYKSNSGSYGENSNEIVDAASELINAITNKNDSKSTGYNISNSILYRTKFDKLGRTLTIDANGQLSNNDRIGNTESNTEEFYPQEAIIWQRQHILNYSNSYRLGGSTTYTEPLTEESQVSLQYRISYNFSDADKKSYDPLYDALQPELSNVYNSGYIRHTVGPGYRLSNKKIMLSTSINYQRSSLAGQGEYPIEYKSDYYFNNLIYFAMMNYTFSPTNTLRVFLRSSTDNPSITQLQDVVDVSNPQFVTMGNSELRPVYSNSLFANYVKSSVAKGRTFMAMFSASTRNNYIADSTVMYGANPPIINGVQLQKNAQLTKPVNMDGYWNIRGALSYGTPIKPIKSNINLNVSATYTEAPSIINGRNNITSGQYYNAGAVLGSNISENIDFTLSYNGGYNMVKNSMQARSNNTYFTQSAGGKLKVVMWAGITFSGNVAYTNYKGISTDFNEEYLICNAYIGKKFLKSRRAEINFGVNDILNQNRSFSRNVTDTYIENVTNNAIGRYYGVQLIFNLRNFGKKGSSSRPSSLYDKESQGPHGGMPPRGVPRVPDGSRFH